MAQTVNRGPLMQESWVRSQVISCEIFGAQNSTVNGFPATNSFFSPVSFIPPVRRLHLHLHVALTRRTSGRSIA
jgi:hypothetical protein